MTETLSPRKLAIRRHADRMAPQRDAWIERNAYFYDADLRYMRHVVPPRRSVLDLGCGTGGLLAGLRPGRGVGVDLSAAMVEQARARHPDLDFRVGDVEDAGFMASIDGPFDFIVLSDTIGGLDDCETALTHLHPLCGPDTRLVVAYYSPLWEAILSVAELLGEKMPQPPQNWLSTDDTVALLALADFEVVSREWRQLLPRRAFGLGPLVNRSVATAPGVRRLCLRNYIVARSSRRAPPGAPSATVVVPCRNERENVEPAVRRIPRFCDDLEILFVEGASADGTREEIERVIEENPDRGVRLLAQDGIGKGDAVRQAFAHARGDVLLVQDGDLTAPPEDLPKFYRAVVEGRGELVMGTRFVYPMEREAMRFLNMIANRLFSALFTWLLNQRITDTLCGTKALRRAHYERIVEDRDYFSDLDPFGDFDLIFGAAKLNLKILEIPVRYSARSYGETQISRFSHGWQLARMTAFAFRRLKAL